MAENLGKDGVNPESNIEEKRQRIREMIEKYGDEEDKSIDREEILKHEENVERIYILFSIKEKSERKDLLEKYQKEADEEQQRLTEEYLTQRDDLHKLIKEMHKLIVEFEASRQTKYDQDEADKILNNIK